MVQYCNKFSQMLLPKKLGTMTKYKAQNGQEQTEVSNQIHVLLFYMHPQTNPGCYL